MQSLFKTLLALALGLGFLALDLHAKPTVAFLGISRDSDPLLRGDLGKRIQWELGTDTGVTSFSAEEISVVFSKGLLKEPEAVPADMPKLAKGLGAQYYAFGRLEPVAVKSKRVIWMPWSLKLKWSQGLRLRILDGSNGNLVFDGLVTAEVPESGFLMPPEADMNKLSPMERDTRTRKMAMAVAVESAKMIAKTLKEKAAPGAAGTAGAEAAPASK
ncbi:MAG: hypothetical protein ABIW76_11405 [Fibrobacteria bacterium]